MHSMQRVAPLHAFDCEHDDGTTRFLTFSVSEQLPQVNLAQPMLRGFVSAQQYKRIVFFMRHHFDKLATIYRLGGVPCFVAIFFVDNTVLRTVLSLTVAACSSSIVSTGLFLSVDVVALLARNYEFWFLVVINAFNWIVVALVFNDVRALACVSSWCAFQIVIFMDANYRTYPSTLYSTSVSAPVVLVIAVLAAAHWIAAANYFNVYVRTKLVGNAADLLAFSTTTLVVFLIKILVHRKTRVKQTTGDLKTIPCVIIRPTLRLVPLRPANNVYPLSLADLAPGMDRQRMKQDLVLSSLPLECIDTTRTLLPSTLWLHPAQWFSAHAHVARRVLYLIGATALALLLNNTVGSFRTNFQVATASALGIAGVTPTYSQHGIATTITSSVLSLFFCGTVALFFQRDLLRLLFRNFDFVFSVLQTLVFVVCLCDMDHWHLERCITLATWWLWFVWVLCLDALTPPVNDRVLHLRKQWTAPLVAGIIFSSGSIGFMIVLLPEFGLRNRVIWHHHFASTGVEFTVETRAVLLGRVVTICLWCTRQAYLRLTRRSDELLLIRGSVEYVSAYSTFPGHSKRRLLDTGVVFPAVLAAKWPRS